MKFFTDCSGSCETCACSGGCLAGHGDDDYSLASKDTLEKRLANKEARIRAVGHRLEHLIESYLILADALDLTQSEERIKQIKNIFWGLFASQGELNVVSYNKHFSFPIIGQEIQD